MTVVPQQAPLAVRREGAGCAVPARVEAAGRAQRSSESGLNAAPLLSVSLARTPDRGLVTINIASRRFLAPLSFTFSTAIARCADLRLRASLRKCWNIKLGYNVADVGVSYFIFDVNYLYFL